MGHYIVYLCVAVYSLYNIVSCAVAGILLGYLPYYIVAKKPVGKRCGGFENFLLCAGLLWIACFFLLLAVDKDSFVLNYNEALSLFIQSYLPDFQPFIKDKVSPPVTLLGVLPAMLNIVAVTILIRFLFCLFRIRKILVERDKCVLNPNKVAAIALMVIGLIAIDAYYVYLSLETLKGMNLGSPETKEALQNLQNWLGTWK